MTNLTGLALAALFAAAIFSAFLPAPAPTDRGLTLVTQNLD